MNKYIRFCSRNLENFLSKVHQTHLLIVVSCSRRVRLTCYYLLCKYKIMLTTLEKIDQQIFLFLNGHHSAWGDRIVYWVTGEVFWLPLYALLVYLMARTLKKETLIALVAIAILITLCDQFASGLIKPWVQRLRPCHDPQIQHLVHVVGKHRGMYGFISSHAANAFGLAMFLWLTLRSQYRYSYMLFGWSAGISYARVYGGVHYPADVVLGALSGVFWGWLIYGRYTRLTALAKR